MPNHLSNIVSQLARIEGVLWQEAQYEAAKYVSHLLALARSDHPVDQAEFERLVTQDKYLWGGMGTIFDLSFDDATTDREFRSAYLLLASDCERIGLASIYSRGVLSVLRARQQGS
jgi:hypothetical protein